VTALKPMEEIRQGAMLALPSAPTLNAFTEAWSTACTGLDCRGISPGFWNSLAILVPGVVLSILLGAINGYALAQWRFPGADKLAAAITLGVFIPVQVVMLPMVKIFAFVGLQGSLVSIVAVHVVFSLPFMALLFRNFFASIPDDLTRAAQVDGAGFWSIFFLVMLPMATNVLLVALVLQFTHIWNDYLLGLIFAGREWKPMTVLLNNIVNVAEGEIRYNVNMAATLLTAIPPLLVYFLSGKYFVRGVTAGATKG
jgi:glucose/mannose transport system permease protein